jgi:hypothetical protein
VGTVVTVCAGMRTGWAGADVGVRVGRHAAAAVVEARLRHAARVLRHLQLAVGSWAHTHWLQSQGRGAQRFKSKLTYAH